MFADIAKAPAVQSLVRMLENGGALSCAGICASAQPFFAALVSRLLPQRPVVVVTGNLKEQESFQQDLETWLTSSGFGVQSTKKAGATTSTPGSEPESLNLFFPAWEILPHEGKLPHADVISDRLQTLVALSALSTFNSQPSTLLVTSVTALLQKTFPPGEIQKRTRTLQRGDKIAPLDLIEWLEEQGYEPEAQVSQKGEIALRGGILDVFPPVNPWPVRLEFFGDELESLREFDPLTQMSRDEISNIILPPAGELGILRQMQQAKTTGNGTALATLLDYLPGKTIFLLCGP